MKRTNYIYIKVKKGKHKSQPWTFEIDMPDATLSTIVPERYSCKKAAIRGALRKLDLWNGRTTGTWNTVVGRKNYIVTTQLVSK
jgi:hypothetical protein